MGIERLARRVIPAAVIVALGLGACGDLANDEPDGGRDTVGAPVPGDEALLRDVYDCSMTATDLHRRPNPEELGLVHPPLTPEEETRPRSVVSIDMRLDAQDSEAARYMARFPEGRDGTGRVLFSPKVAAFVREGPEAEDARKVGRIGHPVVVWETSSTIGSGEPDVLAGRLEAALAPHELHPVGSRIDVYAYTALLRPGAGSAGMKYAWEYCGTIVHATGSWVQSEQDPGAVQTKIEQLD